ncbi:hypothetical protein [Devosia naphthalenivorans]|uniref:hypothetical protein n=1 Tax=Devosia naphthalenivorans TaxID=2082392 RepID=UPI0019635E2A|nr:hypothetical protein [Devosia naphthalenivorans]
MKGLSVSRFPATPVPGLVFRYPYLWKAEKLKGHDEGFKSRPCVVVVRYGPVKGLSGKFAVDVAPISHSPQEGSAVELPSRVKSIMRLDDDASWIVTSEMNRFVWPGTDLVPAYPARVDRPSQWHWGILPQDIFEKVRAEILMSRQAHENIVTRPSM